MLKVINTEKLLNVGVVLVLVLAVAGWFFSPYLTRGAGTVSVTATIASDVTCSVSSTTAAFGTLATSSVNSASWDIYVTLSCPNSGTGCIVNASSSGSGANGGLYASAVPYLIPSPDAAFNPTAALSPGTEGFGILATSTFTSGGFGINARYSQAATTSNTVGKVTTTTFEFASSSSQITNATSEVAHKTAIAVGTPAGDYTENIGYTCSAN